MCVGPGGAGKSSLFDSLLGVIIFCRNEISCEGISFRGNFEVDMLRSCGCDMNSFVGIIHGSIKSNTHQEFC